MEKLSEQLKFKIDLKKLKKEAKTVANQMKESIIKSKLPYKKVKELNSIYG